MNKKQQTRLNSKTRRFLRNRAVPATETTNCDKCNAIVAVTSSHVPDSPVICTKCDGSYVRAVFLRGQHIVSGRRTPPLGYEDGMTGSVPK